MSNAPGMVDIGGTLYKRLTVADLIEFSERVWHEQRRQLLDDLDAAHVSDAARAEAIRNHGYRRGLPDFVAMWAWRLDGAKAIIERAAKNMGVTAPDLDTIGPMEAIRVARALAFAQDEEPGKAQAGEATR